MTDDRRKPTLRELLDAIRPDTDDLADAAFRDAQHAVETSPAWRLVWENQRDCDRRITAAMQDVEFSEDARRRLLTTLAADNPPSESLDTSTAPVEEAVSPAIGAKSGDRARGMNRRRWMFAITTAAGIAAAVGLGLFFWNRGPNVLTLDEIRSQIPLTADQQIDLTPLAAFDESFALALPAGRWERVTFEQPLGIDWSHDGRHDAALLPFVTVGRPTIRGYLIIVPAAAVSDAVVSTMLSTASVNYFPTENTAWTNTAGDTVYLCLVPPGQLPALQRVLYPQSA
ncbi:MAG: hypothetical protein KF861_08875 [Planctomycetaceae bacterium]|nr:hypothetical protein [Planctomycetaceae bacterium]